jgi:hypothetical protein
MIQVPHEQREEILRAVRKLWSDVGHLMIAAYENGNVQLGHELYGHCRELWKALDILEHVMTEAE